MNRKEILMELIEQLFSFDTDNQPGASYSMTDFVGYLNTRYAPDSLAMRPVEGEKEADWLQTESPDQERDISILFLLMYRYTKLYMKKALADSLLTTHDEFSFLADLLTYESLTKTELITEQVVEKAFGTEVIKRLLTHGLIREFADPIDRRSVRVAITDKGRAEIFGLIPRMRQVSKLFVADLNEVQQNTLAYLLKKLDHYHNKIFLYKKGWSLDELSA